MQAFVQQCHIDGIDLSTAGLAPGIQINAAALAAEQAAGLVAIVPSSDSPALVRSRQALALTAAQAGAYEAAFHCTVSLLLLHALWHVYGCHERVKGLCLLHAVHQDPDTESAVELIKSSKERP